MQLINEIDEFYKMSRCLHVYIHEGDVNVHEVLNTVLTLSRFLQCIKDVCVETALMEKLDLKSLGIKIKNHVTSTSTIAGAEKSIVDVLKVHFLALQKAGNL